MSKNIALSQCVATLEYLKGSVTDETLAERAARDCWAIVYLAGTTTAPAAEAFLPLHRDAPAGRLMRAVSNPPQSLRTGAGVNHVSGMKY